MANSLHQGQRELLESAVNNAKELPSLHALNILSLAKYELAHPRKTPPLPGLSSATSNMVCGCVVLCCVVLCCVVLLCCVVVLWCCGVVVLWCCVVVLCSHMRLPGLP